MIQKAPKIVFNFLGACFYLVAIWIIELRLSWNPYFMVRLTVKVAVTLLPEANV